jgi:hypothetical protein
MKSAARSARKPEMGVSNDERFATAEGRKHALQRETLTIAARRRIRLHRQNRNVNMAAGLVALRTEKTG